MRRTVTPMRPLRSVTVVLAVVLLVVGVAACGGDDSPTVDADGTTTTSGDSDSTTTSTAPDDGTTTTPEGDTHEAGTAGFVWVESTGLALVDDTGTALARFTFGESETNEVSMALDQHLNAQGESTDLEECGEGPMVGVRFTGFGVYFQNDVLVGWAVNGDGSQPFRTADDIGIGSTKADLDAAFGGEVSVEETSLGHEWTTMGGISGTLTSADQDGTVDAMWAGSTCIAR
jgi:hypothetical protein